jgi:V8-like Glu-specific endopeptidase
MKTSLLFITSLLISSQVVAAPKVIYGEDNRRDVYDSTNSLFVELAHSTAAMIAPASVQISGAEAEIKGPTMQARGMCKTERFSHQVTAARCSGFLVGENLLVTAGHCIEDMSDCTSNKWVFDYKVDNGTQVSVKVPASSVYSCKKIIAQALDSSTQDDYAFIELDRPVTDRRVLEFRRSGKIEVGAPLVVIGHPTGLPTKIADGAKVRSLKNKFFVANLDTYGGNSGSAVFNADSGVIEGILVRGENDYVYSGMCRVSNVCPDTGCRGEDVTYITNIAELINSIL